MNNALIGFSGFVGSTILSQASFNVLYRSSNIADIVNILKDHYNNETKSPSKSFIFDHAIGELISAQTAVSKLLNTK